MLSLLRRLPRAVKMPSLGGVLVEQSLIDTDILSMFFRGHPRVVASFDAYTTIYNQINISIEAYFDPWYQSLPEK